MGADAFIGFYGIEEVIPADSDFTAIENRTNDRIVRARRSKLDHVCGRITDGRDYHLLIGKKIADLGIEGADEAAYSDSTFVALQADVRKKLKEAGFIAEPRLIFKLDAQY